MTKEKLNEIRKKIKGGASPDEILEEYGLKAVVESAPALIDLEIEQLKDEILKNIDSLISDFMTIMREKPSQEVAVEVLYSDFTRLINKSVSLGKMKALKEVGGFNEK